MEMKALYDSSLCMIGNGYHSGVFECPKRVRQGCILSPTLLSLFINQLATHIYDTGRHGVQLLLGLMELCSLLFADDVTLLATTPKG